MPLSLHTARRIAGKLIRQLPFVSPRPDNIYAVARKRLSVADTWNAAQIADHQLTELNSLLASARRHTLGYAEKFRNLPDHLRTLDELSILPFFTKDELRAGGDRFTLDNLPTECRRTITSGGTTGAPTRFTVAGDTYDAVFEAHIHAMWARVGYTPSARALDLTAALPSTSGELAYFGTGRHFLSIAELEPAAVHRWLPHVSRLSPEYIVAFPSTATAFARLVAGRLKFPALRAVVVASEVLLPGQRDELARSFGARIFSWYGMSELAGFAGGCEHTDTYHFLPSAGIVEIVADDGRVQSNPGDEGEIVLTGFLNRATPFIRYRTGDRGVIGETCRHCRRPHTVLSAIEGRTQDRLISRDGRSVPLSALNFHSDEFRHVLNHQFVQKARGLVNLRIVPLDVFSPQDRTAIALLVERKLGPGFDLTIESVPHIARTPRGKIPVILHRDQARDPAALN